MRVPFWFPSVRTQEVFGTGAGAVIGRYGDGWTLGAGLPYPFFLEALMINKKGLSNSIVPGIMLVTALCYIFYTLYACC